MKKLHPGESFNPHGLFVGAFIPNCILRYPALTSTAKLAWARLQQFGGEAGKCYPSISTIAEEIGTCRRNAVRAVKELVDKGFLQRISPTPSERGTAKATTHYLFLWHPCFEDAIVRGTRELECPSKVGGLGNQSATTREPECPSTRALECPPLGNQSAHNNNHLRHHKEDTTTTTTHAHVTSAPEPEVVTDPESSGCGGGVSSLNKEFEKLPPREQRYIVTMVEVTRNGQGFKSGESAYRNALIRMAKNGKLDTSDLEDREEQAKKGIWTKDSYYSGMKRLDDTPEMVGKAGRTAMAAFQELARMKGERDGKVIDLTSPTTIHNAAAIQEARRRETENGQIHSCYAGLKDWSSPSQPESKEIDTQEETIEARKEELQQKWIASGLNPQGFIRQYMTVDGNTIDDMALKAAFSIHYPIEAGRITEMVKSVTCRKLGIAHKPKCKYCDHYQEGIGCNSIGHAVDGEQDACGKATITKKGYLDPRIGNPQYAEYKANGNGRAKHENAH